MDQQTTPDLLSLPRELRDMIYKHVFEGTRVRLGVTARARQAEGILLASKQTHAESVEVYYATITFKLELYALHAIKTREDRIRSNGVQAIGLLWELPRQYQNLVRSIEIRFSILRETQQDEQQQEACSNELCKRIAQNIAERLDDSGLQVEPSALKVISSWM